MPPVDILIVVGVVVRFSGSGGASQELVLALRERRENGTSKSVGGPNRRR